MPELENINLPSKILILEEQLQGYSSHHFEYLKNLVFYARKQNCDVTIFSNYRASTELCNTLGASAKLYGVSNNSIRQDVSKVRRWLMVTLGTIGNSWIILRELTRRPKPDLILIPTAWMPHVLSLLPAVLFLRLNSTHIRLQFLCNWDISSKNSRRKLWVLRQMLRLLRRMHPKVGYFVQTGPAARDLEGRNGLPVKYAPDVACPIENDPVPQQLSSERPVTFGFYGFGRYEQGTDVLQEALRIFLAAHPDIKIMFNVIWSAGGFKTPDGHWVEPDKQLEDTGKVRFFRSLVLRPQYLELLAATDWVIVPYRVRPYNRRSSLVAVDAACRGIPAIYTKGTNQEEVFTSFGAGLEFRDGDPGGLAEAIFTAYLKNAEYRGKALKKAPLAQSAFSPCAFWKAINEG